MVDVTAAAMRVRSMLVEPDRTMTEHGRPAPRWTVVAREHTLPLLVASALVSTFLLLILGAEALPGMGRPGPALIVFRLMLAVTVNFAAIALMAGIIMFFSGMFGGRADFDTSFALVSLALTPAWVGEALLPFPTLGILIAVAGLIFGLVNLWRGIPLLLDVPKDNGGKVFALTIVSQFVILILAGLALGPLILPQAT